MGTVAALRPRAKQDFTYSLGMIIALGSWAMMFGALFFAYFGTRARAVVWPPVGSPHLPLAMPALNTLVLLLSSVALVMGIRALRVGKRRELAPWIGLAWILGAAFIGLQYWVWRDLWRAGLLPSSGLYGSIFYGLTGLHALHVLAGLIVLLVVFIRALSGRYTEHNVVRVSVCAMFWHFVDVVWVLMFLAVYVL